MGELVETVIELINNRRDDDAWLLPRVRARRRVLSARGRGTCGSLVAVRLRSCPTPKTSCSRHLSCFLPTPRSKEPCSEIEPVALQDRLQVRL